MSEIVKITGYHGTDETCYQNIRKQGFTFKKNDEHWLGNGIYFFMDFEQAEWWAKCAPSEYGNASNPNSVVIIADIDSTIENTIDTSIREEFKYLDELYHEFYDKITSEKNRYDMRKSISKKKMRCMFFEWIHRTYSIEIFIAGFEKKANADITHEFSIGYLEYQMCVYDTRLIHIKERVHV